MRNQVDGSGPAGGGVIRAQIATRVIQEPVDMALCPDGLAIDADLMGIGVDLGTQVAHLLAVDRHSAREDQFFGMSSRADAGMSQEFVKAFHGDIVQTRPLSVHTPSPCLSCITSS